MVKPILKPLALRQLALISRADLLAELTSRTSLVIACRSRRDAALPLRKEVCSEASHHKTGNA